MSEKYFKFPSPEMKKTKISYKAFCEIRLFHSKFPSFKSETVQTDDYYITRYYDGKRLILQAENPKEIKK